MAVLRVGTGWTRPNGIRRYNGSSWVPLNGNLRYYNGSSWTTVTEGGYDPDGELNLGEANSALSVKRSALAGASVGNYALFAGGSPSSLPSASVDAYNTSLTRSSPTALSQAREKLAGASVGNYALFAGGEIDVRSGYAVSARVDAYNTSLTRSRATDLLYERDSLAGASVGNYALFAGGHDYSGGSGITEYELSVVDAYNTSLTRTSVTSLGYTITRLAGASVGNYALFGGGIGSSVNIVNYYTPMTIYY